MLQSRNLAQTRVESSSQMVCTYYYFLASFDLDHFSSRIVDQLWPVSLMASQLSVTSLVRILTLLVPYRDHEYHLGYYNAGAAQFVGEWVAKVR